MSFDNSTFVYLLLIILISLALIQIFSFSKLIQTMRQITKMLLEIRLVFKKSGIYYDQHAQRIVAHKSCQFCRHRISYIKTNDEEENEGFYYRCRQRNIEIMLHDSCENFDRDFGSV
jgi:hypothetical protein